MFQYTDTKQSPWYVIESDDKKKSRLNCIAHPSSTILYKKVPYEKLELPELQSKENYIRPPKDEQTYVPEIY